MRSLNLFVLIAFCWSCHPKKKAEVDVTADPDPAPAAAAPAAAPEPGTPTTTTEPQTSADQMPAKRTCLALSTAPRLLSETGCVNPKTPSEPAAGVVSYEIIAPLWSDGSDKGRYMAVPEGTKATFAANGHLDLPVGGVTMKVFQLQGKPVETRFYMRDSLKTWRAYSYEWRDDGSDAELVTAGKEKKIGPQTWVFPSPAQCLTCHSKASDVTLGLSYMQLAKKDQISALQKAGILDSNITAPSTPQLVDYRDASEPIDARARSYLQGNCAYCHQPDGNGIGNFDLRIQNNFVAMGICNTAPLIDVFPVTEGKIYKPGVPSESILILRMSDTGDFHMPPQISKQVDTEAVGVMEKWVLLRSGCDL